MPTFLPLEIKLEAVASWSSTLSLFLVVIPFDTLLFYLVLLSLFESILYTHNNSLVVNLNKDSFSIMNAVRKDSISMWLNSILVRDTTL